MVDSLPGAPNVSVILPGPCQARCEFCYWSEQKAATDYLDKLSAAVRSLPSECRRVTVTGGEPTVSKRLAAAVDALRAERDWDAVVLATNGVLLDRHLGLPVDHVNLSRHHYDETRNADIFRGVVPGNFEVERLANCLNERGIDVTWSCVLCDQFADLGEVLEFVSEASAHYASAVTFRADQRSDTTERPKELEWTAASWKVSDKWSCEACRTWRQTIYGVPVYWKASVPEPSIKHGFDYEYIIHPDGRLTADWAGNLERRTDVIRVTVGGVTYECDTAEEAQALVELSRSSGRKVPTVTQSVPSGDVGRCHNSGGRC
jgi:pyruvate-formate lyase-activating enzyme